ncbi:3-dehydroquinate synthase [Salinicoccus hispanicus]|uniref:3-dehydroquinate synthase n=1 Tax=Salinicoccus hispanicus TaxID=157225 RepID=A0A6N8U010_9STAP|nr:3-dehydroquinate synthase [Salinicoccus hispanicus]MXQ50276.1 3-dehydroquinate synthase [Salinicoccus hispanicus]
MEIRTDYADGNYTIHVDYGILEASISEYIAAYSSVHFLVDQNVYALYKDSLLSFVQHPIILEGGEASKSFDAFKHITETLLERGIKRNHLIVVIGGGAAGDAGGFAAATVLRGVDYIQVPTTLLAHDSSIGGKTAINSGHGKNLIGAFHRPKAVIYDLSFLETLPHHELLSGFGEVFKHALLKDEETVRTLMDATRTKISLDMMKPFIISGIETKMHYVTTDEKESGIRKFLNLGHTLGHAIEYKYRMPHGMAVMLGLYFMMYASNEKAARNIFDLDSFRQYFELHGYPLEHLKAIDEVEMMTLMGKDKKNQSSDATGFVLMNDFGQCYFTEIDSNQLKKYISQLKESL